MFFSQEELTEITYAMRFIQDYDACIPKSVLRQSDLHKLLAVRAFALYKTECNEEPATRSRILSAKLRNGHPIDKDFLVARREKYDYGYLVGPLRPVVDRIIRSVDVLKTLPGEVQCIVSALHASYYMESPKILILRKSAFSELLDTAYTNSGRKRCVYCYAPMRETPCWLCGGGDVI